MLKTLFLICPLLLVWALIGFFSYGNYSSNQYVKELGDDVSLIEMESLVDAIPSIYSDAVFFSTEKYESLVKQISGVEEISSEAILLKGGNTNTVHLKALNEKIEALYSEVAWSRPLSPSSWIHLSNWSADNEFIQNASYYLSTGLLLLKNKPTAAWELLDLSHALGEKELAINIAGQYLQQNPSEISYIMSRFAEPNLFGGDSVGDVILSSFSNKNNQESAELMSKYVLNTTLEEIDFSKYLFELTEINNFDISNSAANRFKYYFNKRKDFIFLNRLNSYFSGKGDLGLTINSHNTNNKGQICWNIANKPEIYEWTYNKEGGVELFFNETDNVNFRYLSCGFFLNEYDYITDSNGELSIQFTLAGENVTSASGFYADIYQPEVGRLSKSNVFTDSWKERVKLNFKVKDYEKPIYFRLRRDKSSDLNNLLSGKVILSDFSIVSESGKQSE